MLLLEYSSIPLKFELSTTPAQLQPQQNLPEHTVTKTGGELTMQTRPAQLRLDSYERRASMGMRGISAQTQYMKQSGREAAMEATRNYAEMGNRLRDFNKGANIPDVYYSKMMNDIGGGELQIVPLAPIDVSWEEGMIKQQFDAARVAFDWRTDAGRANFVPGSITMNITQYPSMSFKYLKGPVYVPPSADPTYNKAI